MYRTKLSVATIPLMLTLGSPVDAQTSGADFVNSISRIEANASQTQATNPPRDTGLKIWEDAKRTTAALCACNELQRQYQGLSLEYQTWQDEFQTCYYDYYLLLGTPGGPSVGEYLDCITPVNAGLIGTRSARQAIDFQTRQAPCDAGASCPVAATDDAIRAEVFQRTRNLFRQLKKLSPSALAKKIRRGLRFLVDPHSDGVASTILEGLRLPRRGSRQVVSVKIAEGSQPAAITLPADILLKAVPGGIKHAARALRAGAGHALGTPWR